MKFKVEVTFLDKVYSKLNINFEFLPITIGRDPACDICLDDERVSKRHARLDQREGKLFLYDSNSLNGVFVNNDKVGAVELKESSEVKIGEFRFSCNLILDKMKKSDLEVTETEDFNVTICEDDPDDVPDITNYKDLIKTLVTMYETIDHEKPVQSCLKMLTNVLPINRIGVFTIEENGEIKQSDVLSNANHKDLKMSRTFINKVIETEKPMLLIDTNKTDTEDFGNTIMEENIKSILGCPIKTQGRISAVILCENLDQDDVLHEGHLSIINLFAGMLNSFFQKESIAALEANEIIREKEFLAAKKVQQFIFTKEVPKDFMGYDWECHNEAALHVGGDFYDFYTSADKKTMYWIIGDVSGKGVGAAMIVSMLKAYCNNLYPRDLNTESFLVELNQMLFTSIPINMFFTCQLLKVDETGFSICNAGHNPGYLISEKGQIREFKTSTLAVGMAKNELFSKNIMQESFRLEKGDMLVLYTDGITEAMNEENEVFGDEPFKDCLLKYQHISSSKALIENTIKDVVEFREDALQSDDITMLVVKSPG
jgi:phosphoserine phosphatase RsbU/P